MTIKRIENQVFSLLRSTICVETETKKTHFFHFTELTLHFLLFESKWSSSVWLSLLPMFYIYSMQFVFSYTFNDFFTFVSSFSYTFESSSAISDVSIRMISKMTEHPFLNENHTDLIYFILLNFWNNTTNRIDLIWFDWLPRQLENCKLDIVCTFFDLLGFGWRSHSVSCTLCKYNLQTTLFQILFASFSNDWRSSVFSPL